MGQIADEGLGSPEVVLEDEEKEEEEEEEEQRPGVLLSLHVIYMPVHVTCRMSYACSSFRMSHVTCM